MSAKPLYKIVFIHHSKVYELFSKRVQSSNLWGFIEVAELVFEPGEGLVVDPTEERVRQEFAGARVLHLPIQSVLRVEEVEKRGKCLIRDRESGENVTPFPLSPPKRSS